MKKAVKIAIDTAMVLLLPCLMAYSLISDKLHEYLGIAMLGLFVMHHILNYKWFKSIFKGRYTPYRIYANTVNILLVVIMFALPISGIAMSRYALPGLALKSGLAAARKVHMLTAYWGLVLMSLHAGNHAPLMMNGMRKMFHIKGKSKVRTSVLRVSALLICGYGCYAFYKRGFADYLTMRVQFAFFDLSDNRMVFLLDYFAVIGTFAVVGYYIGVALKRVSKKNAIEP